jgi:hypothetical protein
MAEIWYSVSPRRKPKRRLPKPMENTSDTDAAEFGDGEVAELVDENHDAEDDEKLDDCGHERRRPLLVFVPYRRAGD